MLAMMGVLCVWRLALFKCFQVLVRKARMCILFIYDNVCLSTAFQTTTHYGSSDVKCITEVLGKLGDNLTLLH